MAIALDPDVLIADEPTTALDVTVQAQVMRLLKELQVENNMGLILITHDLGVVADVADKIAVMYAGQVMEVSDVYDASARPPWRLAAPGAAPDGSRHRRCHRCRRGSGKHREGQRRRNSPLQYLALAAWARRGPRGSTSTWGSGG